MNEPQTLPITRATFNVTRACNLRCTYCFTHGCTYGRMSLDTAKAGIKFLVENALNNQIPEIEVSFWGGEPLLEMKLLKDMCEYTRRVTPRWIRTTFGGTTNGVLLTPEVVDICDDYKIGWMISIDGTEEHHDKYRRTMIDGPSHATIMRNMTYALKKWPWLQCRLSVSPEFVSGFFDDMKYLFEYGFEKVMFSPVHELEWTDESFNIWEDQCYKLIDWMADQNKTGRNLVVEHFSTYHAIDSTCFPCGAGRFYAGIDIDGAIYPCHRFCKFDDPRPWHKREVAIGHVEIGITNPEFRDQFINWKPGCSGAKEGKDCFKNTPCHGGCYAVNYDLTGDIHTPTPSICKYVAMQQRVSKYYISKGFKPKDFGPRMRPGTRSCQCYNMCYHEGKADEVRDMDANTDQTCICYFANYTGERVGNGVD